MGYFDDLYDSSVVTRPLTVKGKTVDTHWKELTAGQRLELLKGQVIKTDGDGVRSVEVVLSESAERQQRLVQMTLVDGEGKQVYKSLKELQAEPSWLVDELVKIAQEVHDRGKD